MEGVMDASPAMEHELLLNVRATGEPATLHQVVETELAKLPGDLELETLQCFSPAAPEPEHRFSALL